MMKTSKQRDWAQQKEMIKQLYPTITDEDLKCPPGGEKAVLARVAAKVMISEEALHAILREKERGEDVSGLEPAK